MLYPTVPKKIQSIQTSLENGEISQEEFEIEKEKITIEIRFFGFRTKKHFWYAIGKSLTILYLGLYLMFTSRAIVDLNLKRATYFLSFLTTGIGIYFRVMTT